VDHPVGERDAALEPGRKAARLQASVSQVDQPGRVEVRVRRQAGVVDPGRVEPGLDEPPDQVAPGQLVKAVDMGDHVAHPPAFQQAGRLPLVPRQRPAQRQQLAALAL